MRDREALGRASYERHWRINAGMTTPPRAWEDLAEADRAYWGDYARTIAGQSAVLAEALAEAREAVIGRWMRHIVADHPRHVMTVVGLGTLALLVGLGWEATR